MRRSLFYAAAGITESRLDDVAHCLATGQRVLIGEHPDDVAHELLAILAAGDRSAQLANVRVPTLVLHGDHYPLVNLAGGEETARRIPGARLKIIPAPIYTPHQRAAPAASKSTKRE